MKVSEQIPLGPQKWNLNPNGYVRHQAYLKQLVEWLETTDAEVQLPEDRDGWDLGVDVIVNGMVIDLKGFQLDEFRKSLTWRSPFYKGRRAPVYKGSLTDYYVHPTSECPSEWIVAPVESLHTSEYGHAPYYRKSATFTMADFIEI